MQKNGIGEVSGVVGGGHLHLLLLERNQDHDVAQEIVLLLVQPRSQHMRIIFTNVVMFCFVFFLTATSTQLCITFPVQHRDF